MNSMLTIILLSLVASAATKNVISSTKKIEQNGEVFIERMTVKFAPDFDKTEYLSMISKLGYIFQPHSMVEHSKTQGDQKIFATNYTIGDYGLRVLPPSLLNTEAKKHLIVAGDSNVFSEGTSDAESLTAQMSSYLKSFYIYNFGHRGGGPHNTLSMMEHYPFEKIIAQKDGVFLYNFFTGHMFERVIGSKNYIAWDLGMSPYYDLDRSGRLVYRGNFNDRKWISGFYKFISSHNWLNQLLPILPQIDETHVELITQVFLKMKSEYLKKFPGGRFVVIINDSYMFKESDPTKWLKEKLLKNSIEIIEIAYQPELKKGMIFKDMHLNGLGQKMQSQLISEKLLKILSL